ncbi:hypothetical protein Ddye_028187 [Dipteronia dyeriana]|uniref:Uncharacterized protein n=1 Tax=Dipteronia dyeriana TaxID=168575 RepID=A0AAD9TQZ9_9ROSI|nr:hypothetical protein Ddye_028187 [Dipteronia dyeriana]
MLLVVVDSSRHRHCRQSEAAAALLSRLILDNTNAPEQYRIKCLENIGSLWRDWKSRVKKEYYLELGTDEARLAITHSRVIREQGLFHKTGRTPFSEVRNQPAKKGKKTDRVSMFIETRTRIDKYLKKTIIEKEAAHSQFEEHLRHIPEEEQNDIVREHVFTQVMGPDDHSRVRLYGTGTSSSNVAQNSTVDEMRVKLDELRSTYKDLQSNSIRDKCIYHGSICSAPNPGISVVKGFLQRILSRIYPW